MHGFFLLAISICALINILAPKAIADSTIITHQGGNIELKDDGTWRYLENKYYSEEFQAVYNRLKKSLRIFIYDPGRVDVFEDLGLYVRSDLSFEPQFKGILEYLKEKYAQNPNYYYGQLINRFGISIADDMEWLFKHWDLWQLRYNGNKSSS